MKAAVREYRRLAKSLKVMEGKVDDSLIRSFLARIDDRVLEELRLKKSDREKLGKLRPRERAKLLGPYFERHIQKQAESRVDSRLQLADELARTVVADALVKRDRVHLPSGSLYDLARTAPTTLLHFGLSRSSFVFPVKRLRTILAEMDEPRVEWHCRENVLYVLGEDGARFTLISLPEELAMQMPTTMIDFSAVTRRRKRDRERTPLWGFNGSVTDYLLKAAESILGI